MYGVYRRERATHEDGGRDGRPAASPCARICHGGQSGARTGPKLPKLDHTTARSKRSDSLGMHMVRRDIAKGERGGAIDTTTGVDGASGMVVVSGAEAHIGMPQQKPRVEPS